MRYTPNYNMVIGEGTDAVNPLTQIFPNFETIDSAMESNKNAGITTASEVTTGGVHAIVRVNTSAPVFRFTATSAWTTGDTMTLDGSAVTVHLTDGTTPKSGAYIIGAEVVGIVNGSLVTLLAGSSFDGVLSFNSRQGVVTPQSGDYTANMIGYNNTTSGLSATDIQSAIDELASNPAGDNYSTSEHVVGTWIDGSVIYEKTISCGALPNNAQIDIAHGISNLGAVISIDGIAIRPGTNYRSVPLPCVDPSDVTGNVYIAANDTNVIILDAANWSAYTSSYVTIRYTKNS